MTLLPSGVVRQPDPIYWARMSAQCLMSTTFMNYALGAVVVAGALAVTLAILVW